MLEGLPGVLCIMDDVIVFGANQTEHDARLTATLRRIEAAGVTLNPRKCEFLKDSIKFLGHVVASDGIRADPDKQQPYRTCQLPRPRQICAAS